MLDEKTPEKYLSFASSVIGEKYHLLMVELGISHSVIGECRVNNFQDMREAIYELLLRWKNSDSNKCTLRVLLGTMDFVGTDWSAFQDLINDDISKTARV